MKELAEILGGDPDHKLVWWHDEQHAQGLCIRCETLRISFIPTTAIRDKGRHNLHLEIWDREAGRFDTHKFIGQCPQVKLSKSATAIFNQLKRAKVVEQLMTCSNTLETAIATREREGVIAQASVNAIAQDIRTLRTEQLTTSTANLKGNIGGVDIEGQTKWHKPTLLDVNLRGIHYKDLRALLEMLWQLRAEADE